MLLDIFQAFMAAWADEPNISLTDSVLVAVRSFYALVWQIISYSFTDLFDTIYTTILSWFDNTYFNFAAIGRRLIHSLDKHSSLEFFTHDFVYWLIGILVFFFVLKILISIMKTVVSFIGGFL